MSLSRSLQAVDPATVSVWRIQALLIVIAGLVLVGVAVWPLSAGGGWWAVALAAWGVALVPGIGLALWLPLLYYRRLGYRLDARGLTSERGLLWRHRIAVPKVRIQHSDISQGPLQRAFGVATLRLYTAGSRFTVNALPGLNHDTALALRERLLDQGDGDAV